MGESVWTTWERRFPAVVSTEHEDGRITTVGTLPNPALAAGLLRWLAPDRPDAWHPLPPSVTRTSATNQRGERIHVLHNWGVAAGIGRPSGADA